MRETPVKLFTKRRTLAFLLILSALAAACILFSPAGLAAEPDFTFSSGAVLLDSSYSGKNILIQNGVFSVTVSGAQNVSILFENVTMDRRYSSDTNATVSGLYAVSTSLGWTSGSSTYAQTCPFLITNGASVTAAFRGRNEFYAGTNRCRVYSNDTYSKAQNGGGFAGIQVNSGSSLTIASSTGEIYAYGAFYVEGDNSENSSYGYSSPTGTTQNALAGGAGIGGGVDGLTTTCDSQTYTAGTPGTIRIDGGFVYAYGGHQAAGIGGGLNSAATSSSIQINGGTVEAHGGRWAAGIGDGDSLQNNWTTAYSDSYLIEINGGTVTTVGGVACPGIGSTDELSAGQTRTGTSGMEIRLNGGRVSALSGYPDGFNPSGSTGYSGTDAAAAIGAGNRTNLESNSISIASGAYVLASGFGHYSITENGVNYSALPTVNIDSDGYMFLGRFPELTSSSKRTFDLVNAQHFLLEIDGLTYQYTKYVSQPTDGSRGEIYYYCPEAPNKQWLMKAGADGSLENASAVALETGADLIAEMDRLTLTLWVDETSSDIAEVQVPAHFRSIALTLPSPEELGGIYAFLIPVDSLYGYTGSAQLPQDVDYVVITIGAQEQGTLSGELVYPSHLNILTDSVSETLTDLDLYRDASHTDGRNGLIGEAFSENKFAYTVYLDPEDDIAYLYARYPVSKSFTTSIESFGAEVSETEVGADWILTGQVDMTGLTEKIVRIKKTDAVSLEGTVASLNSVVYKITIRKKETARIELLPLDKTYDGHPVSPSLQGIVSDETDEPILPSTEELLSLTHTYYNTATGAALDTAPKAAGTYRLVASLRAGTYVASVEQTFTIRQRPLSISHIQNALTYVSAIDHASWTAPRAIPDPGTLHLLGVVAGDEVAASAASAFYNEVSIGYGASKITLTGLSLSGKDAANYSLAESQTVFGQISYSFDGAIFRKKTGQPWDKFYPVDSLAPVSPETADYHSTPSADGVYNSHSDYVYARTENTGESRSVYAVDIEFGAMSFTYSRSQWNADSLTYEELEGESRWLGFDGVNNSVRVINRSNSAVWYAPHCKIDFIHSAIGNSTTGIRAQFYADSAFSASPITGVSQKIAPATAGSPSALGTAESALAFLRLSGVPQLSESNRFTVVGHVTVTLSSSES